MKTDKDTGIGGENYRFPGTRDSLILSLNDPSESNRSRAMNGLIEVYWKPVYKYIRIKWHKSNEDAKDLTQSFFATAVEKSFFQKYDAGKARFRTFLRNCLDGFLANDYKASHAIKRGGKMSVVSIDFPNADAELASDRFIAQDSPESYFEMESIRSLFSLSLQVLEKQCHDSGKEVHFELFRRVDLDSDSESRPSYKELASEFAISVSDVTNYLAFARREFRKMILNKLREITATEREFRIEARSLLGVIIDDTV